jgi:hypothetical protein
VVHGTKGSAGWAPARSMLAVGGVYSANGGTNARNLSTVLSVVDSVHSGGSFPFLHRGRGFLITLRGARCGAEGEQDKVSKEKKCLHRPCGHGSRLGYIFQMHYRLWKFYD